MEILLVVKHLSETASTDTALPPLKNFKDSYISC